MGDFDKLMAEKLESNGIAVTCNGRYVDDINTVIQAIPYGWRWVDGVEGQDGRMEYDDDWVEEDEVDPLDRHTMRILVKIADTIKTDLAFSGDCCSNNEDGYIPVLDLKMKPVLVTETAEGRPPVSYYQITFKFYKKPMARKSVMNANTEYSPPTLKMMLWRLLMSLFVR